jgi:hypothetical protein
MTDQQPIHKYGVYFLANDVVYDWTIAFLNSFRTFNPDLPLYLIPFNDDCDRVVSLKDTYNFEVYTDDSFSRLEAIGEAFELGYTKTGPYWFRRYAAFWGPVEQFMYLDTRQVILADLKPFIQALEQFDFDFLHYDCALDQVYEPGEFRREMLRKGKGRGFNSGRWASRRGLFSLEEFETLGGDALKIREQLNPRNTDQAFINYCCDMKPVRYGHFGEVIGGICQDGWARKQGEIYQQDGKYFLWDYGGYDHKKQVVLLHWAGYSLQSLKPHSQLYNYYFNQHHSLVDKTYLTLKKNITYIFKLLFKQIRTNRKINTLYHKIRQ